MESPEPVVTYTGHTIGGAAEAGDGRLYPGEEAELQIDVRNYGADVDEVYFTLECPDPRVQILDHTAHSGPIASGEVFRNDDDPFIVVTSPLIRPGYILDFTLTADYAGGSDITTFPVVVGKYNFLVWDPTGDQSSGPVIFETLQDLGYSGHYRQSIDFVDFEEYNTIFISLGVYANTYKIPYNGTTAPKILDYLDGGGCVYLEGGDVWAYDPVNGGYDFSPYFKLVPVIDGYPDLADIVGQPGTIAEGLRFAYEGENFYIDRLTRTGAGQEIFENSYPDYACGVAYDAGSYKTIGTSFEFAGLMPDNEHSTRHAWAGAVMDFFMPETLADVPDDGRLAADGFTLTRIAPTPLSGPGHFRFALPREMPVRITLHDVSGRLVETLFSGRRPAGEHRLEISGAGLAPGLYFLRSESGEAKLSRKVVVAR